MTNILLKIFINNARSKALGLVQTPSENQVFHGQFIPLKCKDKISGLDMK